MDNKVQDFKEKAIIKGSILLAILWDIASTWPRLDMLLESSFSPYEVLIMLLISIGVPGYIISFFMKRYNNLYVKSKLNVRRISIMKGFFVGLSLYACFMFVFYFVLGLGLPYIYATIALFFGCFSAHSYLKKNLSNVNK